MPHRALTLIGAVCILGFAALGTSIRVDSNLVLIPVSVTDPKNHAVTGLGRDAFRVFEDRTEQRLEHFAREDAPVSVGIVFDASGSMKDNVAKSRDAVARFLETANPEDEFFLVEFSDRARLAVPFTGDAGSIRNRLLFAQAEGKTSLLDAVCLAADYMRNARNSRRVLLILSDGGDNDSRYTQSEIRSRVRESDMWIYAIGIYERGAIMLPEEERSGETLLSTLAEESGGRHFALRRAREAPAVAAEIGLELRNQYLIGYRPAASARDGRYHRVQVKVVDARDLRVTWRRGYYTSR
jgi:VWFA-related protein